MGAVVTLGLYQEPHGPETRSPVIKTDRSAAGFGRSTKRLRIPCLRAFRRDAAVLGPVECWALARLASRFRSETCRFVSTTRFLHDLACPQSSHRTCLQLTLSVRGQVSVGGATTEEDGTIPCLHHARPENTPEDYEWTRPRVRVALIWSSPPHARPDHRPLTQEAHAQLFCGFTQPVVKRRQRQISTDR